MRKVGSPHGRGGRCSSRGGAAGGGRDARPDAVFTVMRQRSGELPRSLEWLKRVIGSTAATATAVVAAPLHRAGCLWCRWPGTVGVCARVLLTVARMSAGVMRWCLQARCRIRCRGTPSIRPCGYLAHACHQWPHPGCDATRRRFCLLIGKQSLQQGLASVTCGLMVTHRACRRGNAHASRSIRCR